MKNIKNGLDELRKTIIPCSNLPSRISDLSPRRVSITLAECAENDDLRGFVKILDRYHTGLLDEFVKYLAEVLIVNGKNDFAHSLITHVNIVSQSLLDSALLTAIRSSNLIFFERLVESDFVFSKRLISPALILNLAHSASFMSDRERFLKVLIKHGLIGPILINKVIKLCIWRDFISPVEMLLRTRIMSRDDFDMSNLMYAVKFVSIDILSLILKADLVRKSYIQNYLSNSKTRINIKLFGSMLHAGMIDLTSSYVTEYIEDAIEEDNAETIKGIPSSYFTIATLDALLFKARILDKRKIWRQLSRCKWELVKVNADTSLIQALSVELGLSALVGDPSGKFMMMIQLFPVHQMSASQLQTLVNLAEYAHVETKAQLLRAFGVPT